MPLPLDIWGHNKVCKIGCQSKIGCPTNGLSDQWAVEPMGCRTNGLSNQWAVGILGRNQATKHVRKSLTSCWFTHVQLKLSFSLDTFTCCIWYAFSLIILNNRIVKVNSASECPLQCKNCL